jgi:GTP-binding protein
MQQVDRAVKTHRQRIKTSLLNEVLSDALMWQKPPAVKASQIGRIYYCNQVTVFP